MPITEVDVTLTDIKNASGKRLNTIPRGTVWKIWNRAFAGDPAIVGYFVPAKIWEKIPAEVLEKIVAELMREKSS